MTKDEPVQAFPKLSYSVREACAATGLSKTMIFNLLKSGDLEGVKVRGKRLIEARSLEAVATGRRAAA